MKAKNNISKEISRRKFVKNTVLGTAGLYATAGMSAKSYANIMGSNDRINIGFLGTGGRSRGHRRMVESSYKEKNLRAVAVCDIWSVNREKAAADCKTRFGEKVKQFKYSEDMLNMKHLDAVMIATGDHQHAKILAEVVNAGKDCYCEKPMAQNIEEAKMARDTVLNSKQVVQMGSQWVSEPAHIAVRDFIRSGRLGKITKIEHSWNDNNHRWHNPNDSDVASIREEDTDWSRWLLGKPWRPFDPWAYFEFRIFKEFSGGITSQWMSHAIGLVHFYTDTAIPDTMVANGGIFGWDDIRENPDTFQALGTYDEAGFLYSYSSSYANKFGDHTVIRGKNGTLYSQGGEGSPRWFFIPEHQSLPGGFDFYAGVKEAIAKGIAEPVYAPQFNGKLPPTGLSDNSKAHLDNWIDAMRDRNYKPNGHIMTGYWHSIGIIMATRAYREGKKMYWDRKNEQILTEPPKKA
jgi:predicted dehydrogenase